MATLTCRCGHVISNNTDGSSPYIADFLPEKEQAKLYDTILAQAQSLVTAIQQGQTIGQWQGTDTSSPEVSDALLVHNLFTNVQVELSRSIYQCEKCNRLLVQRPDGSFRTFLPEADDSDLILDAAE
jgi:hypothetical protein